MKRLPLAFAILLALGCGDPQPAVQPIVSSPRTEAPPRPPELLDPGMRVRQSAEQAQAERERLGIGGGSSAPPSTGGGGGGGGGGGPRNPDADPWPTPRMADPPTNRELEAFRRELEAQMAEEIDPDHDPCMQLRDTARASSTAIQRSVRDQTERPPVADRAAFRRGCREMRPEMQECLDRDYFREHLDECQRELARLSRAGERRRDQAQRQLDQIDRGLAPDPSEPDPPEED